MWGLCGVPKYFVSGSICGTTAQHERQSVTINDGNKHQGEVR